MILFITRYIQNLLSFCSFKVIKKTGVSIFIGGKNKTRKQITGIENAFIAADNIEYDYQNKIPLWLFGFLY